MQKIGGKEIKIPVRDKEEIDLPWGGKLVYVNSIVGGSIDARFMPAILKGINGKNGGRPAYRIIRPRYQGICL